MERASDCPSTAFLHQDNPVRRLLIAFERHVFVVGTRQDDNRNTGRALVDHPNGLNALRIGQT